MTTAVVTGATSGIGLGFAEALAAEGHDLVVVARNRERLAGLADRLTREHGVAVDVLPADLADRDQLTTVEQRCADPGRPIELLVNNAGLGLRTRFVRADVEDEQYLLDVLVTAPMRLTHAAARGMIERGSGGIVNVSSISGWLAAGTYSAAKAWLTTFTEGLQKELRGTGVRATAVCPGFTHTEFHERADMDMSGVPDWMWLDVDEVVRQGLADLRSGRPISVAGTQYRVLSLLARYAPRPLVRRAR